MLSLARRTEARLFPQGWTDALRQLLLFAAAYLGYELVRGMVDGQIAVATWNATKLIWIEHQVGFFVEPSIQAWATTKPWLIGAASWLYLNAHFIVSFSALVWLYRFRNPSFYWVRNMYMVAMALALVGYALYPTMPPRLMSEWGFTDSVANFTGVSDDASPVSGFVNHYAAVPSMHVAFAVMIGWPLARLVRPPILKAFWALYPLLVTFIVVSTGNHYILDAVLGAMTAGVSALVAQRLFARVRPAAWAFSPSRAEAPA
jgi:membrane-associated phospholipid phosphatase